MVYVNEALADKYGIGHVVVGVADDFAMRKYGWTSTTFRKFLASTTSIRTLEKMIPGVTKSIEECLKAMSFALERRGLIVGELSPQILQAFTHYSKYELVRALLGDSPIGELRKMLNRVVDYDSFSRDVFTYTNTKLNISPAYFAIMTVVKDANANASSP